MQTRRGAGEMFTNECPMECFAEIVRRSGTGKTVANAAIRAGGEKIKGAELLRRP